MGGGWVCRHTNRRADGSVPSEVLHPEFWMALSIGHTVGWALSVGHTVGRARCRSDAVDHDARGAATTAFRRLGRCVA